MGVYFDFHFAVKINSNSPKYGSRSALNTIKKDHTGFATVNHQTG